MNELIKFKNRKLKHKYNKISNKDVYNSLTLISEYIKKNIFAPNNINFPTSRLNFINYFK